MSDSPLAFGSEPQEEGPIALSSADVEEPSAEQPLSKNAQKRLLKAERFAANKLGRRVKEKERKKEKKRARQERRAVGEDGEDEGPPTKKSRQGPVLPFGARIVIDLGFDDKMSEKEIVSLTSQLAYTYNVQRKAARPFSSLLFTNLNGDTKTRLDKMNEAGYKRWGHNVTWWEEGYDTLWKPSGDERQQTCAQETVVYLTADAEDVLEELHEGETYIIGGICDHNRYKNLCLNKAKHDNIRTAQLPIAKYIANLPTRKVLTVNQVYEILTEWVDSKDWDKAFHAVIPKRKFQAPGVNSAHPDIIVVNVDADNHGADNHGLWE